MDCGISMDRFLGTPTSIKTLNERAYSLVSQGHENLNFLNNSITPLMRIHVRRSVRKGNNVKRPFYFFSETLS